MKRRWFIRALFMLPLLLCILGWSWSAKHYGCIQYAYAGRLFGCISASGVVNLEIGTDKGRYDGWDWEFSSGDHPSQYWPPDPNFNAFLPFSIETDTLVGGAGPVGKVYYLIFPYWFLILIFSVILFFVRRKTRPKRNTGMAFPIEVMRGVSKKEEALAQAEKRVGNTTTSGQHDHATHEN